MVCFSNSIANFQIIQRDVIYLQQLNTYYRMNSSTIPQPPNSAWLPPLDPNDEQTLEQEQAMIEQEFKNILTQDMVAGVGAFETRQQQQQQEQGMQSGLQLEDEVDEMEDYTDEIQMPDQEV